MKKKRSKCSVPDSLWEIVPEIDQHEVRFSEYLLKPPKNSEPIYQEETKLLEYGIGPHVDCEVDDNSSEPDFSSYILPNVSTNQEQSNITEKKKELKKTKKQKVELSLDSIFETLRQTKLTKIRKIIKESKNELMKVEKNSPNKNYLSVATQLYKIMFNPDQKYWIYMYIRRTLGIPPHEFRNVQHVYKVLAPEAALIVFQKIFKFKTKIMATGKLAELELLDTTFYKNIISTDVFRRL